MNSNTSNDESPSLTEIIYEQYQVDYQLDDLENGFANAYAYQFSINIESDITAYQIGTITKLSAIAYKNEKVIDSNVSWSSNDTNIASIDEDGNLTAVSSGSVIITAYLEANPDIFAKLSITIEDIGMTDDFVVQISPEISYLLETEEQIFEAYLYNNGIKQTDSFAINDISAGIPRDKYEFKILSGNSFSVLNKEMFMDKPVIIKTVSGSYSKQIEIELRGLW